ncbi:hypothetical protein ACH3XW_37045 [Acanthocheilonema viteae]
MTKEDLMIEWRKQRKATVSSSEIGQRPLYDSAINSDEYQPSSEPALSPNESIICCKHGIKCNEYYNRKFDEKEISSLWPISELFNQVDQPTNCMKTTSANSATSKEKENYKKHTINSDWYNRYKNYQYDDISIGYNNSMEKSIKTSSRQSLLGKKSLRKNNANIPEIFPDNSKLEILDRFYLGQRSRSASTSLTKIPQNFRLYHELPENVSNLDSLKQYAPLYIVFVNNDLEYRHLLIQECFTNGKRRFFVECGDRNIRKFKKLEYLIRHYANTFAYIDSHGRRSRFPDNPEDKSIHESNISNK